MKRTAGLPAHSRKDDSLSETVFTLVFMAMLLLVIMYPETFLNLSFSAAGVSFTPLVLMAPVAGLSFLWYFLPRLGSFHLRLLDAAILTALAYTLIRLVLVADNQVEIKLAMEYVGYAVVAYYGAASLFRDASRLRIFSWVMVIGLGFASFYEVLTFLLSSDPIYGSAILKNVPLKSQEFYRGGSTLGHPVALGGFLIQTAPFVAWVAFKQESARLRGSAALVLILAFLAGLLTFSKGAWVIGGIVMAAVLFVERKRVVGWLRQSRPARTVLGVSLFVAIAVIVALTIRGDLQFQLFNREESYYGREYTWQRATGVIADNALFGVGLFRGLNIVNGLQPGQPQAERVFPVDNYYLSVLVEQGLVGVLLYGIVLVSILTAAIRLSRRPPPADNTLPLMLTIGLFGILADAFIFDAFLIWPMLLLFWTMAGLLRAVQEKEST